MAEERDKSSRHLPDRVEIGEILGAHGVRGEVRLRSFAQTPADIKGYSPLLGPDGDTTYAVSALRGIGTGQDVFIATIAGISSREAAQALAATRLYVARDSLPPRSHEEYLRADLVGCRVSGGDGRLIGEVVAVQDFGAGDLIEIRRGSRTELVPFTRAFVPVVDLEGRRLIIVVDPFASN
jgi:16S rRNA processing protein RimM